MIDDDNAGLKLGCTIQELHALRSIKSTLTFSPQKIRRQSPILKLTFFTSNASYSISQKQLLANLNFDCSELTGKWSKIDF